MTPYRFTRLATACALGSALLLSACSSGSQSGQSGQSGDASASGSQSGTSCTLSDDAPDVDRSGEGNFPDATGGFGEDPTISAGTGDEPDQVLVKTLSEGDGDTVGSSDFILANYTGTLWDGTVFDSSYSNGQAVAFGLDQVVSGWKYGLADQHVGDRVEIVIPCEWGYGGTDNDTIPAGSTLVFVVDIEDAVDGTDTSALTAATATGDALPAGISVDGDLGSEPTVAFSGDTAPGESTTTLATGTGEAIADSDYVLYQAVGSYFEDPSSMSSTWSSVGAQLFQPGIGELVGQTVGSRLLFVFPPTADASESGATEAETSTTVMVVDVLATLSPQS